MAVELLDMTGKVSWLLIWLITASWFNLRAPVHCLDTCHLRTNLGDIVGSTAWSESGKPFCSYRAIPYAEPPTGNLRFKAPQPTGRWSGVLKARTEGPICVQLFLGVVMGEEDCLYLNVYTPVRTPNSPQKLPVIVFIHGGKFVFGSGASVASAPDFIMNEDVIFVTINYRLGVLGFFSTGDDEAPGNFGLKDQVAALRWVQHNIAQFGGDPKKVTLMGQSAGSKSVHLHMFSSLSKGLFQRAISQSGSAFSLNIQPLMDYTSQARQQAQIVGCSTNNSAQLVRCLRGVDVRALVSEELNLWQPVLEKRSSSNPEPFLTASPLELVQSGDFYKVPWLMGSTSQEGAFMGARKIVSLVQRQAFSEHMDEEGPDIFTLGLSLNQSQIPENWKRIRHFYFGEGNNTVSKDALSKLYTDRMVVHSVHKAAVLHSQAGQRPIFKYNFGYRGKYSYVDFQLYKMTPVDLGVVHTDDLIYLVPLPTMRWWPEGHPDLETLHVMVAMWTNFAKYGNPTPNCANIGLVWQPFNTSTHAYLNISQDIIQVPGAHGIRPIRLSMETFLYKDRMQFWDSLPLKENIIYAH
ncbi:juvenile hormone esterase-like [Periplaneta americana]|uniref:juvenile hormone esterase-like n=1 Tax=Periplaneta americana TaxID=6978 RepID=UPI0037E9802F